MEDGIYYSILGLYRVLGGLGFAEKPLTTNLGFRVQGFGVSKRSNYPNDGVLHSMFLSTWSRNIIWVLRTSFKQLPGRARELSNSQAKLKTCWMLEWWAISGATF